MRSLITKLETDPAMRVRAAKIMSSVMLFVSLTAAAMVGYISLMI